MSAELAPAQTLVDLFNPISREGARQVDLPYIVRIRPVLDGLNCTAVTRQEVVAAIRQALDGDPLYYKNIWCEDIMPLDGQGGIILNLGTRRLTLIRYRPSSPAR